MSTASVLDRDWLSASGEMAERVRSHDWSATPLGRLESWPPELRHSVELVLAMPYAASVMWGRELLQIYNDPSIVSLGHRHPEALGRSLFDNLAEFSDRLAAMRDAVFFGNGSVTYEDRAFSVPGPDDHVVTRYFTGGCAPIRGADGRVLGIVASGIDTSLRARAEATTRANEARFLALSRASSEALFRLSADGVKLTELTGGGFLTRIERPDRDWMAAYVPPEDHALVCRTIADAVGSGKAFELEHRVCRADGTTGWVQSRAVPIPDPAGGVAEWFGAAADISSRKEAEATLRTADEHTAFLLRFSDTLRALADPVEMQETALRMIADHLRSDRTRYFRVFDDGSISAGQGPDDTPLPPTRIADFGQVCLDEYAAGRPLVVNDVEADRRFGEEERANWRRIALRSAFGVPLRAGGRLAALLTLGNAEPRRWSEADKILTKGIADRLAAALDRARADVALATIQERNRAILDSARDYAIFTTDGEGQIESWGPGAQAVLGWEAAEIIGRNVSTTFVAEDRDGGVPQAELATACREGVSADVRWHIRKDGSRVLIEGTTRPLLDPHGHPRGFLKIGQDVTERRRWEDRQKVLLAELQHRTRNLLGVVRSMFDRTARDCDDTTVLSAIFRDRLMALARVQSHLSQLDDGDRVSFDELICSELSAVGAVDALGRGARVVLDGPRGVRLRSATLQTFALALHELATNASKHGALAQAEGRLSVVWRLVRSAAGLRLRIEWTESGVQMPQAGPAETSGYGRELIERALPYQMKAETTYRLDPGGVRCTIEMPVSETMPASAAD